MIAVTASVDSRASNKLAAQKLPDDMDNEAKVLAVGSDAMSLSMDGTPEKIDDFEELLKGYGIVESQRTGRVALPKLEREARKGALKGKAS